MRNKRSFAFLLLTVVTTSCANNGSTPQAIGTPESVPAEYAGLTNPLGADAAIEGAKVFQGYCESCHGPQGRGDGPAGQVLDPQPRNLSAFQAAVTDDYLFWRVNTGKPGTAMIGWQGILTEEQVWQVIAFIRTLKP